MNRLATTTVLFALFAALPCCAANLSGSFRSADGKHMLTFASDGTVRTKLFGKPIETRYLVKDRQVSFMFPGGLPVTYTVDSGDTLTHPALRTLKKL